MTTGFEHALVRPEMPLTPPLELFSESAMLAEVDRKRNELQMEYLTRGTSLSLEYAQIQLEVRDYQSLTAVLLAALTQPQRQIRWPIASMEMELTGKTVAQVMATYIAAINNNEKHNRVYGRIAVVAKAKIRAATTLAAKRKIFCQINWNWMPSF